ncbi:MAG: uroporphyrinogen decarboxylase [Gemmatimonadaceae bacterium]
MNDRLIRALRGEATDRRPVWVMRQAGRYLPEYRALRAVHSFEALSGNAQLAAEVTLQPLARFPLDAAIIFADLISPVGSLGIPVRFDPGPVISRPVRTIADVDALIEPNTEDIAPEVIEALGIVKRELSGKAALLGFAGAPWSIAAYLVQGKSSPGFPALRALAARDEGLLCALLTRLTDLAIRYVGAQVAAGADAVQLFDTWAGTLSVADWSRHVKPHMLRFLEGTRDLGVPRILFVQDAPHLVESYAALPSEAIAVDWREDLPALRAKVGPTKAIQGNLDPAILLAGPAATSRAAKALMSQMPPRAHVMNLGHGIMPETPIESMIAFIDAVHGEQIS